MKKVEGWINIYKGVVFDKYITSPIYSSREKALNSIKSILGYYIDTTHIEFIEEIQANCSAELMDQISFIKND